ncbi:MAG: hypothetical protein PVH61_19460 [Candidatus Aminicenantes bacterium]|jgi:hypothetical protein
MKERGRHIIEVFAIGASISGLTLSELRSTDPIIFYSVFFFLLLLCFFVFLSWKKINRFTNKPIINSIWQRLLQGSERSIRIFAGDVSWLKRDEKIIKNCVDNGIEVSVLCRRPGNNQLLKENISRVIECGAKVRYYELQDNPVVRGLVIDAEEKGANTALTVQKTPQKNIERHYGVPGTVDIYKYQAARYIPPQDAQFIEVLNQLFHFISHKAMLGVVLHPLQLDVNEIRELISMVPHYANIKSLKFNTETIMIRELWSSCIYVKDYKFPFMRALLDAYETQDFHCFEPCLSLSHEKKCILLPPILERHKGKLVVIDGIHRLYYRYIYRQQSEAQCLIIDGASTLPGEPVPFVNLKVIPRKLPREQNFIGFKPDMFRNIEALDNALVQVGKSKSR